MPPLDKWPLPSRNIAERFGVEVAWAVGLRILGYPPTWLVGGGECGRVASVIEQTQERLNHG